MKWPDRVQEIVNVLVAANQDLAHGDDNDRRALTLKIAQQCCYELGFLWGTKKADPYRPPSKDAIAYNGGVLTCWDTLNGTTREPNQYPEGEEIPDQVFIPVEPYNHIGEIPDDNGDDDMDLTEINAKLDRILRQQEMFLKFIDNFAIRTAHGVISFQPDGTIQYRSEIKSWESLSLEQGA